MKKQETRITADRYTDRKNHTHSVIHSLCLSKYQKNELESKITAELYRIFTSDKKF